MKNRWKSSIVPITKLVFNGVFCPRLLHHWTLHVFWLVFLSRLANKTTTINSYTLFLQFNNTTSPIVTETVLCNVPELPKEVQPEYTEDELSLLGETVKDFNPRSSI